METPEQAKARRDAEAAARAQGSANTSQAFGPSQGGVGVGQAVSNSNNVSTNVGTQGGQAVNSAAQAGAQVAAPGEVVANESDVDRMLEGGANTLYNAVDPIIGAAGDAFSSMGDALSDSFSAEQVSGPNSGQWGSPGTIAAGYNQGALSAGAQANARQQGQGNAALVSANQTANILRGQAGYAASREAPQANWKGADHYGAQASSSRNVANELVNEAGQSATQEQQLAALNNFANAKPGASAAEAQLQQAGDAAQRSALSMARSGRGAGDSASALRDASFNNSATQGQIAGQTAQLRAQEEATFRQQQLQALDAAMGGSTAIRGADTAAAQVAQGTRAQDLQAQAQAADRAQFDVGTQLNQQQMNDSLRLGLGQQALGYTSEGNQTNLGFSSLGQGAEIDYANLGQDALDSQAQYELEQQQMRLDAAKANQSADLEKDSGLTGMISSGVGALFALSDERTKKLEREEKSLADALETMGNAPGYSYKYKNPNQAGAKAGRMIGPMAQDIERGPLGDTVVKDTPQGKMVDQGRVEMLNTSAITELNHKVKALEAALGKRKAS